MNLKRWPSLGFGLILCAVLFQWRANRASGDATTSPAPPGATTRVSRGDLALSLDMTGMFEPVGEFELRVRPREFHDELMVRKCAANGAKVGKGDVLLELETDKIDAQIAAAENDWNIATANLVKAQADGKLGAQSDELAMTNAKNDTADAQARVKRWDAIDGEIFVLSNGMEAKVGDFNVENSTDELDQLHKMYKSEDLTSATADIVVKRATRSLELQKLSDRVSHAVADKMAQVDAVIQRRKLAADADQHVQVTAELQAAQDQQKIIRQTTLVTATAAAEQAQRKLARLKADREMFSVSSPIDGVLIFGSFDRKGWHEIDPAQLAAGEKVEAGRVVMTVYVPTKLRLRATCPESQIALISPKSKMKIMPSAIPGISYQGECESVSNVGQRGDIGQTFDVLADLPAVDGTIVPGFSADVQMDVRKLTNVLLVPNSAVAESTVWVLKAGKAEARPVVVGRSDGQMTEIKSGVGEGDLIVLQGKHANQ